MPKVRGLRTIKKEILKLISTYVDKADDLVPSIEMKPNTNNIYPAITIFWYLHALHQTPYSI